jgi:hypothetical protein
LTWHDAFGAKHIYTCTQSNATAQRKICINHAIQALCDTGTVPVVIHSIQYYLMAIAQNTFFRSQECYG